jgi:hypothetical protein
MPTWTEDTRSKPGEPDKYFEGSELLFGFSDVHSAYPKPVLNLVFAPIPEPATWSMMLAGLAVVGVLLGLRRSAAASLAGTTISLPSKLQIPVPKSGARSA